MAEQETAREDKKLPASERKLANARREGQVARSRDLGHALLLASTLGCLVAFFGGLSNQGRALLQTGLRFDASHAFSPLAMLNRLGELSTLGIGIVLPIALVGVIASICAAMTPGGFNLTTKPLLPKWERLSPVKGIKRLCSRSHLVDSLKLAVLVSALTAIGAWFAVSHFDKFANLIRLPLYFALNEGWNTVAVGATGLLALLILVAMIDVPLQWARHRNELKMTLQEARQESKESDGDPHLRARIRARQREIGSVRMMAKVATADVIVSNPTHYAVALKYDGDSDDAPRVIAKGVDHMALKIRELGANSGVPLLEAPALARALYAHVRLDQEVPAALYNAVAQVLAYIFQLRQAQNSGDRVILHPPEDLPVPPELDPASDDSLAAGAV